VKSPLAAFAALLLVPGVAGACEACKNALADDPEMAGFSKGIYVTIVVMLAVVFGLVGILVRYVVKEAQKSSGAGIGPR
jgi:hypothetical protein